MRACNPQTNQPYASHREAKNLYECECECESAHLPAHRQSFPIPRPESKKRPQSNPIQSNPIQSNPKRCRIFVAENKSTSLSHPFQPITLTR